jgi:hypothetical protein
MSSNAGPMRDALMASLASDQSVMRKIQSRAMSRAKILLGIRWSSSLHRAQVGPIVQHIVVDGGLGGITSTEQYSQHTMASVKGDFHLLQQIQQTQNKTQHQHRNMIQELIIPFFEETNDPMVYYIKHSLLKLPSLQALHQNNSVDLLFLPIMISSRTC